MHRCNECGKKVDVVGGLLARHGSFKKMCMASGSVPFVAKRITSGGKVEVISPRLPGQKKTAVIA